MRKKWYRDLNPRLSFKTADSSLLRDTGSLLQATELGNRFSASFNGSMRGFGADWIVMDDPNDMNQINSEAHRNKIKDTFDQSVATRLNNKNGRTLLVTQGGHIDDLTGHPLENGGFEQLAIEAVATRKTSYDLEGNRIYTRSPGELIDQAIASENTLHQQA